MWLDGIYSVNACALTPHYRKPIGKPGGCKRTASTGQGGLFALGWCGFQPPV